MPVEVLWKARDILRAAEYLMSTGEDALKVVDEYKRLYRLLIPYVVLEKDRAWLMENLINAAEK